MEAKAQFLAAAACLYATQSPAVAANLMLRSYDIRDPADTWPKSHKILACAACGSLQTPGNLQMSLKSSRPPGDTTKSSQRKIRIQTQSHLVSTCTSCGSFSHQTVPEERREKKRLAGKANESTTVPAEQESGNSGKRRKRKKAAGLQDLLAKADRAGKTSQPGLDLMDLMQAPKSKH